MSNEKVSVLTSLGCEVVRTPSKAPTFSEESYYMVARRLVKEGGDNWHILDQYGNPSNQSAHYKTTGQEIYDQCDGDLDYLFAGAGTGGTITGVSKKLKELNPKIKAIAIDPYGSALAYPESLNKTDVKGFTVEGIGKDFIPDSIDRDFVDGWVKTYDGESYVVAR